MPTSAEAAILSTTPSSPPLIPLTQISASQSARTPAQAIPTKQYMKRGVNILLNYILIKKAHTMMMTVAIRKGNGTGIYDMAVITVLSVGICQHLFVVQLRVKLVQHYRQRRLEHVVQFVRVRQSGDRQQGDWRVVVFGHGDTQVQPQK